MFEQILNALSWLIQAFLGAPAETIAIVLGAAGVSVLTQVVKKLGHLEREKVVIGVFTFIAFLASLLDYLITSNGLPPTVLGFNTAVIMGVAQPIYYYVIKPLNRFLVEFKGYKASLQTKVEDIEAVNTVADIETKVIKDHESTIMTPTPVEAPKPAAPVAKVADF
jgi:hypothetical protein